VSRTFRADAQLKLRYSDFSTITRAFTDEPDPGGHGNFFDGRQTVFATTGRWPCHPAAGPCRLSNFEDTPEQMDLLEGAPGKNGRGRLLRPTGCAINMGISTIFLAKPWAVLSERVHENPAKNRQEEIASPLNDGRQRPFMGRRQALGAKNNIILEG